MYRPQGLTAAQIGYLHDAIRSAERHVVCRAQTLRHDGTPLAENFILSDGSVDVDAEAAPDAPTRVAEATILDPDKILRIDSNATARNDIWFSKKMRFFYGIWVPELDRYEEIPVFTGPVQIIGRRGIEVTVIGAGEDVQHIDPYLFPKPISYSRATKVYKAWKRLFEDRGETQFRIDSDSKTLGKAFNRDRGQSPWKSAHRLAKSIRRHQFFDGEGTAVLRERPKTPVWVFNEGEGSILVDYPTEELSIDRIRDMVIVTGERYEKRKDWRKLELDQKVTAGANSVHVKASDVVDLIEEGTRIKIGGRGGNDPESLRVSGSYTPGSRTIDLTRNLSSDHGVGAPVEVMVEFDKRIRPSGKASLPDSHSFSAQALTGGKRPRVEMIDNPRINTHAGTVAAAQDELDDIKNQIEVSIPMSVNVNPLLEENDPVAVEIDGRLVRTRAKNFTIPLNPHDDMSINAVTMKRVKKWRSK